jgi:hypothetical protein
VYRQLLDLRRGDPVLSMQDRDSMEAKAVSPDVLSVRRWRDGQERLLLVNFGTADTRVDDFGSGWRIVLDSGQPTQVNESGVTVAPKSATVLARDTA